MRKKEREREKGKRRKEKVKKKEKGKRRKEKVKRTWFCSYLR